MKFTGSTYWGGRNPQRDLFSAGTGARVPSVLVQVSEVVFSVSPTFIFAKSFFPWGPILLLLVAFAGPEAALMGGKEEESHGKRGKALPDSVVFALLFLLLAWKEQVVSTKFTGKKSPINSSDARTGA